MPSGIKKPVLALILFLSVCATCAFAQKTMTWQDCVGEAAKNHPDLISAQEVVKQSEAAKKITASTLFPQIDAGVTASTTKTKTSTSKKTTDAYSYGVTGTQLLFDGTKTFNNVKAASENIKANQFNYKFTSSTVRLRLRTAFINVLKYQEFMKLTEEIQKIRRDNLILISLRYESGIEHKGALLAAEANVAEAEFEIAQAKRALEVAQRELSKEMGRTKFSPMLVGGDIKVSDSALEKPDFETLALNNPSLGKLIANKNAASFGLQAARANFFPTLSASAGVNKNSNHWLPENDQWNAGLTMSLPLFEGGLKFAELSQARSVLGQASADERSTKDGVVVALSQMWAALQDSVEIVGVQTKFLKAAEERAKIAQAQYSLGMIQFDNWTIIEDDLVSAKKSFLNSQAEALFAEANWVHAKGEVLENAS